MVIDERSSSYRIAYLVDEQLCEATIFRVGDRKDIYRQVVLLCDAVFVACRHLNLTLG